jgi:WD40 repeat protein
MMTIIVWNLDSGSIIRRISLESSKTQIQSITFLDDQLFTGGYDLIARQVDVTTGKITTVKSN